MSRAGRAFATVGGGRHDGRPPRAVRIWARAFAAASVIHLLLPDIEQAGWAPWAVLELTGALWLLIRPGAFGFALCALGTLGPLLFLRDVLTQSALLTLWGAISAAALLARRPAPELFAVVRGVAAATYLLAALHKLNSDFFDPATSCAHHAAAQILGRWGVGPLPPALEAALPTLVIAVELLLALALWRRSPLAWPLGLAFHLPLTVTLAPAFGAVMLAAYTTAVSPRDAVRWRRELRRWRPLCVAGAVAAALETAIVGGVTDWQHPLKVAAAGALTWASLTVCGPPGRRWWGAPARRAKERAAIWPRLAVAIWLLHGLTPYLGWRMQHTAAMLSNLRIDPPCHNSLVFPAQLIPTDPYLRIDQAQIGQGQRPKREATLRAQLWSRAALHTMHRNWCTPELRPITLTGTDRGHPFTLPDLCEPDWERHLPGPPTRLPGHQRFQKNLPRACNTPCVH